MKEYTPACLGDMYRNGQIFLQTRLLNIKHSQQSNIIITKV